MPPPTDSHSIIICKVTPNARRSEFLGWTVDEQNRPILRLKLAAPAQEGKANAELVRFMTDWLGCGRGEVCLLRGETSRNKAVRVSAAAAARLRDM
jgi:hypothetical protein